MTRKPNGRMLRRRTFEDTRRMAVQRVREDEDPLR